MKIILPIKEVSTEPGAVHEWERLAPLIEGIREVVQEARNAAQA